MYADPQACSHNHSSMLTRCDCDRTVHSARGATEAVGETRRLAVDPQRVHQHEQISPGSMMPSDIHSAMVITQESLASPSSSSSSTLDLLLAAQSSQATGDREKRLTQEFKKLRDNQLPGVKCIFFDHDDTLHVVYQHFVATPTSQLSEQDRRDAFFAAVKNNAPVQMESYDRQTGSYWLDFIIDHVMRSHECDNRGLRATDPVQNCLRLRLKPRKSGQKVIMQGVDDSKKKQLMKSKEFTSLLETWRFLSKSDMLKAFGAREAEAVVGSVRVVYELIYTLAELVLQEDKMLSINTDTYEMTFTDEQKNTAALVDRLLPVCERLAVIIGTGFPDFPEKSLQLKYCQRFIPVILRHASKAASSFKDSKAKTGTLRHAKAASSFGSMHGDLVAQLNNAGLSLGAEAFILHELGLENTDGRSKFDKMAAAVSYARLRLISGDATNRDDLKQKTEDYLNALRAAHAIITTAIERKQHPDKIMWRDSEAKLWQLEFGGSDQLGEIFVEKVAGAGDRGGDTRLEVCPGELVLLSTDVGEQQLRVYYDKGKMRRNRTYMRSGVYRVSHNGELTREDGCESILAIVKNDQTVYAIRNSVVSETKLMLGPAKKGRREGSCTVLHSEPIRRADPTRVYVLGKGGVSECDSLTVDKLKRLLRPQSCAPPSNAQEHDATTDLKKLSEYVQDPAPVKCYSPEMRLSHVVSCVMQRLVSFLSGAGTEDERIESLEQQDGGTVRAEEGLDARVQALEEKTWGGLQAGAMTERLANLEAQNACAVHSLLVMKLQQTVHKETQSTKKALEAGPMREKLLDPCCCEVEVYCEAGDGKAERMLATYPVYMVMSRAMHMFHHAKTLCQGQSKLYPCEGSPYIMFASHQALERHALCYAGVMPSQKSGCLPKAPSIPAATAPPGASYICPQPTSRFPYTQQWPYTSGRIVAQGMQHPLQLAPHKVPKVIHINPTSEWQSNGDRRVSGDLVPGIDVKEVVRRLDAQPQDRPLTTVLKESGAGERRQSLRVHDAEAIWDIMSKDLPLKDNEGKEWHFVSLTRNSQVCTMKVDGVATRKFDPYTISFGTKQIKPPINAPGRPVAPKPDFMNANQQGDPLRDLCEQPFQVGEDGMLSLRQVEQQRQEAGRWVPAGQQRHVYLANDSEKPSQVAKKLGVELDDLFKWNPWLGLDKGRATYLEPQLMQGTTVEYYKALPPLTSHGYMPPHKKPRLSPIDECFEHGYTSWDDPGDDGAST